ncbi:Membrane protein [Bacillus cereus]|nr:Membrane protein [Bacillus cereus]
MLRIQRGFMYDPDDNEVIVNEIFYNTASEQKLGSKMSVFAVDKLPTSIFEKIQENESMSYMESMEVEEETIQEILCHLDQNQKPEKLYFELQYMK